jgi:hypothetical protein
LAHKASGPVRNLSVWQRSFSSRQPGCLAACLPACLPALHLGARLGQAGPVSGRPLVAIAMIFLTNKLLCFHK